MYHRIKTVLYYGTVSEISHVDVKLGRGRKDFGRGFYMAVSKSQAVGMMHKKYKEVVRRSRGKQDNGRAYVKTGIRKMGKKSILKGGC